MTRQQRIGRNRMVSPDVLPLAGFTVGGFFFGLLVAKISLGVLADFPGFLKESTTEQLAQTPFLPQSLFFFLLKRRTTELVFLLLLSMTFIGKLGMNGYLAWVGVLQGIFFMTLVQRYEWQGAGFFLVASLPQSMVLLPALCLLFSLNRRLYTKAYRLRCGGEYTEWKTFVRGILLCFGLYAVSAWLQSYVNPFFIQKYLQIFSANFYHI